MTQKTQPPPLIGESDGPDTAGVLGEGWTGDNGTGVYGRDKSVKGGSGVIGYSDLGRGVWGHSNHTGIGVLGQSSDGPGVYGSSVTSDGVLGEGAVGVYGRDTSGNGNGVIGYSDTGHGVWGHSNQTGVGVLGQSSAGPGVQGSSVSSDGVLGEGAVGVHGLSDGGGIGVLGESFKNEGIGVRGRGTIGGFFEGIAEGMLEETEGIQVVGHPHAGYFDGDVGVKGNVVIEGDFTVFGAKSAAVFFPDRSHRKLYSMESPECWFEDFGSGDLVNGEAEVQLRADFASVVSSDSYHVFLTEYEDNNALFVANRTNSGFCVRAKSSTTASSTFSYRIVAKRKDIEGPRFEEVTLPPERRRVANKRGRGGM
jgi:hypothetical protein